MDKTRQYYDTIQEAISMMFRLPFKEYYPETPTYDVIQAYDTKMLKLDISLVMFEVKGNGALRETEALFHSLLEYKTDNWLNPEPSVMYNQDAISQRLRAEGYDDKMIEFYLSQVYKVQCTVMERIEFIRRMIDFETNKETYKDEEGNDIPFDSVLSPIFRKEGDSERIINEEVLKQYFNRYFFGGGMSSNYWLSYVISLRRNRRDKDFARIAHMTYNSKFLNQTKKPKNFKSFYETFCRLVGCKYHKDYKESNLKKEMPHDLEIEFSFLSR